MANDVNARLDCTGRGLGRKSGLYFSSRQYYDEKRGLMIRRQMLPLDFCLPTGMYALRIEYAEKRSCC
jgi:hypothetical protein